MIKKPIYNLSINAYNNQTNKNHESNCECNEYCDIVYLIDNDCTNITFSGNNSLKFSDVVKSGVESGELQKIIKKKEVLFFQMKIIYINYRINNFKKIIRI